MKISSIAQDAEDAFSEHTLSQLTLTLMSFDSTTGQEAALGHFVAQWLNERGFTLFLQPIEAGGSRCNVFATWGEPHVVLSTHLDCVPPFIPPTETATHIMGRGACDAKGIMAAQLMAAWQLKERGIRDFGVLFLVGEESDSIGAKTFAASDLTQNIRFIINGEPTQSRFAAGQKGVLAFELHTQGEAGHSAYPERFQSALHPLIHDLNALLSTPLPGSSEFGESTLNIGKVQGGVAANVTAPHAHAQLLMRVAAPLDKVTQTVREAISPASTLKIVTASEAMRFYLPEGESGEVVGFGTDGPHLGRGAIAIVLYGPGSIHDAHTAHEWIDKAEQARAVTVYAQLVTQLQKVVRP